MINPRSLSDQLLFSTLRIEAENSVGTGFFYSIKIDSQTEIPLIVTNKHVVAGSDLVNFNLHESKKVNGRDMPTGGIIKIKYKPKWINHPDNKTDLCATALSPILSEVDKHGKSVHYTKLTEQLILPDTKLEELSTVEDVLMIGYPIGLWDEVNNLPLVRKGITSTHPAINFQGENEGVVDMAVFPGSSGSPILVVNEGSYAVHDGITLGRRAIFLGVLQSGPIYNSEGNIVTREIPTSKKIYVNTEIMINLGYYIKAKEVIVLANEIKRLDES